MPNRLAQEASPYLQQHACNPVDWYPWGPEALVRAQQEDKPILLSIGYSACHWCHVMERESFENDGVAKLMNEWFVNVKVDREERPDLDQVYQLVLQLMGRSGGWPLTVFLTPNQKPFFGGTYFPPVDRHGMPGFPKVLQAVWEAYGARREEVDEQSAKLARAIEQVAAGQAEAAGADRRAPGVSEALVAAAGKKLASRFDSDHGGFGHRPKFPNTMSLDVLLRTGHKELVRQALDAMREGGIWDHLGGGFHRYSTDERWLVPHFEKMLYDNALLLRLYIDGWRVFEDDRYADTARAIAAYIAREMTSPQGGFYATQDADSEGEEGKFFVWTPAQVEQACGHDAEAARAAMRVWGVSQEGNFGESGATVLSLVDVPRDTREAEALERARRAMFLAREGRPKPFRDEKVLAGWNGLLIGALAEAGAALGASQLVEAAAAAMRDVEARLCVPEGGGLRLARHCKDGEVKGPGFLDDHAFVGDAALDLYDATGEARWVRFARAVADSVLVHFHDAAGGGFFFSADDAEKILVRTKDAYDHAIPSGASVAARLLLRLGSLVDPKYAAPAEAAVEAIAGEAAANPMGMSSAVCLVDRLARGSVEVVLVGPRQSQATRELARIAHRAPLTDRVLAWADPADASAADACGLLAQGKPSRPEPAAYVCRGRACSLPISDPNELARRLATP